MIKEHEKQNITKIPEDDIQRYIRRILQRFFEIEGINSRESKEAMIVESIRRYKEFCKDKGKDWLIGLNGMTGLIYLSITVLGGELKINHHTAFNKDFGDQADTICEGNDPRLSNEREPLEHVHLIQDIENLETALDSIGAFHYYSAHSHFNYSILNKIIYNGAKDIIDITYLEQFAKSVKNYVEHLLNKIPEIEKICNDYNNNLSVITDTIENRVFYMEDNDTALNMINWVEPAEEYAKDRSLEWIWEQKKWFKDTFLLKTDLNIIKNQLLDANKLICDGEIIIDNGPSGTLERKIIGFKEGPVIIEGDSLKDIYDYATPLGDDGEWIYDVSRQSFVEQKNTGSYCSYNSITKFRSYIHRVRLMSKDKTGDDDIIGTIVARTEDDSHFISVDCSGGGVQFHSQSAVFFPEWPLYHYESERYEELYTEEERREWYRGKTVVILDDLQTRIIGEINPGEPGYPSTIEELMKCPVYNNPANQFNYNDIVKYPELVINSPHIVLREDERVIDTFVIPEASRKVQWKTIRNGISLLIKRTANNIKVWYKYDEKNIWQPDSDGTINPSEEPIIDYDIENPIFEQYCKYGYSCESQPDSYYDDVYLYADDYDKIPIFGDPEYNSISKKVYELPTAAKNIMNNLHALMTDKLVKVFFRWEDDSNITQEQPVPFFYMLEKSTELSLQCEWNSDNQFIITHSIQTYFPEIDYVGDNFYTISDISVNSLNVKDIVKGYSSKLYEITNKKIQEEVSYRLKYDTYYYIDGIYNADTNKFVNWNGSNMSYPDINTLSDLRPSSGLSIQTTSGGYSDVEKGDSIIEAMNSESGGFVGQYIPIRLLDRFKNARIYFQIFNTIKPNN